MLLVINPIEHMKVNINFKYILISLIAWVSQDLLCWVKHQLIVFIIKYIPSHNFSYGMSTKEIHSL